MKRVWMQDHQQKVCLKGLNIIFMSLKVHILLHLIHGRI